MWECGRMGEVSHTPIPPYSLFGYPRTQPRHLSSDLIVVLALLDERIRGVPLDIGSRGEEGVAGQCGEDEEVGWDS